MNEIQIDKNKRKMKMGMKHIFIVTMTCLVSFLFFLSACTDSTSGEIASEIIYEVDQKEISFVLPVPEGWEIDSANKAFFEPIGGMRFSRSILNEKNDAVGVIGHLDMREEILGKKLTEADVSILFAGLSQHGHTVSPPLDLEKEKNLWYAEKVLIMEVEAWHDYAANLGIESSQNKGLLIGDSEAGTVYVIEIDDGALTEEQLLTIGSGIFERLLEKQ